ncbi:glycosyltransferase family 2 protein [Candidatus Pacearchaeota archaeon]|nr:glycosyltransferase family 2 protein [Candidatus Pacearchaeota archaeon]
MKIKKGLLSIAIPTYNEEKDIGKCLESISIQDYPKKLIEVIIIDNYSSDNTIKIAKDFSKFINVKVLMNKIKDAEVSKKIGFDNSNGEFFMYLDADMRLNDKRFIKKMLFPFEDNKKIAGNFVKFTVNKSHPPLTRTLSYDEFQRDPIFRFFTIGINNIVKEKKEGYLLCYCDINHIPPQGLMIYRKYLISDYIKNKKQLIDNEIPAVLIEMGYRHFAFVPDTGVEHLILRSLKELWRKRIRNLRRTYYPNINERKFRWINWKKDWPKIGLWLIYTHILIFPVINGIYKSIKNKDFCFLNEPLLNLVSTYSIIYGVISSKL